MLDKKSADITIAKTEALEALLKKIAANVRRVVFLYYWYY